MKSKDKRKPETIIRELKRELEGARRHMDIVRVDLHDSDADRDRLRNQLIRAETEAAEWKRRFDALLAAIPELRKVQG